MTPLDHALAYAALGWRVAPIPPGYKYPHGIDRWQELATTDPERLRRYWALNPDHGMCIATGPGSRIVAIDIDTYHGGDDGWRELLDRLGVEEVETVEAITGGGGRHLVYAHPNDGGPVITNAAHALPPGVDVRGDGGQIVVAPTVHPGTGARYAWEVAHDPLDGHPVAEMPAWLAELLRTPPPAQEARRERGTYVGGDSIVDRFNAEHTWPELLEPAGWTFHSARNDPAGRFELWTRPGKDPRDGASASLYYLGSDVLKVFTSSAAPLAGGETYTRFGFWAAMHHGGDHSAAARAARRDITGPAGIVPPPELAGDDEAPSPPDDDTPADTAPRRPSIVHNGRQLHEVVTEAVGALEAANTPPSMFVRGGQLARLREDEGGRPLIEALRSEHVRGSLSDAADWYRVNKDGIYTATPPPLDVAATVLARGHWPAPALAGVVELPVLRPDGTFVTEHGYDTATKLYHWHRGEPYPAIPDAPSTAELAAAVALVDDALCDFPWDSTADRANAWALLVTPLVRPLVGQVPMALVDAPEPGTGKGLLVKVAAIITMGRAAALMAWPTSDEELEKKVTAALMAGSTMVIWDNVEGMVKSSTLAAVLTADTWQGRVLGRSEMTTVPNRATWAATGNNIDVGGDLARRCYRIRLDARQAQPWLRTGFRHTDLEGWVTANRGRLLHALCTIVRSWWRAGRPQADGLPAMGGYASWVRTVGGVLEHAGVVDFLANLAQFHAEADREAGQWEAFLGAWSDAWGEQPRTVAELVGRMDDAQWGSGLREALPDDLSGHWGTSSFTRRLGMALRKRAGRHYGGDGLHLVEMPRDRTKVAVYSVTTRSVSLFSAEGAGPRDLGGTPAGESSAGPGAGLDEVPRGDDPPTWDDAFDRGTAGAAASTYAREIISPDCGDAEKTQGSSGVSTPAVTAVPRYADEELF